MKVEIWNEPNDDFLKLAEYEFLKKKKRPGTLISHFPFLSHNNNTCFNIILKGDKSIIGGMILKINKADTCTFGSVGLVVIDENHRGKNYSSLMMHKVIETAKKIQLDYLVLWTSLHDYYRKFGFVVDEPLAYLELEEDIFTDHIYDEEISEFCSRPTYTYRLGCKRLENTTVNYIYDGSGYIFTDYTGDAEKAAKIITNKYFNLCRPRVNIDRYDPLIDILKTLQPQHTHFPTEYEMWLKINPVVVEKKVISFLNRI
ncbi:GNAT family N-acetyltransferase [Kosakonia sacchari]|uniref:GNAT family N-acetyltransferase n=1 Tax=Kosakonia sacchari TaxID=1158459 RepID=UPI0025AFC32F|nr:GNAT family N-acetyltransferase [Kosakonia sacchari]MDN2486119.1 GNAT family N-acetyltransferase [Kosakonia sacchari]